MADRAHEETDKMLESMERHLSAIYSRAQADIAKKSDAFFSRFREKDEEYRQLVEDGKMSEAEYREWRKSNIMRGKRFTQMKEQFAQQLLHVNETATSYINRQLPEVYAMNYNALESAVDGVGGYSFTLVDAETVRNLAESDAALLPYKKIDPAKDIPWNTKKINAEILQGILQGESIPDIAGRLATVTAMNETAAMRNARTMVTAAECKGRQDSYIRATNGGIELQREWIAAIDGRTRHAHRLLDGHFAAVDEPFDSELGPIMYPGDPGAHPANVYNCRCTIAARVISIGGEKVNEELKKADRRTAQDFYEENPEEFEIRQKMLYNKKADMAQFTEYKSRLGSDAPRSFAEWQSLKYREAEKYTALKSFYRYKRRVPEATKEDYEIEKRIHEMGIVGTVRVPAEKISISNLSAVDEHAFRHGCTIEDAKNYIRNAKVSITRQRWDGTSKNFFSDDGAVYIDGSTMKIKTMFGENSFDPETKAMLEVFK